MYMSFNHLSGRKLSAALLLFIIAGIFAPIHQLAALAKSPVTITVAMAAGYHVDALKAILKYWEKEHPDIKVRIMAFGYHDLYEKIVIDMREGRGSYDVIEIDDPWMPEFCAAGWLANIDELVKKAGITINYSDFVDTALWVGRCPYKTGHQYALPECGNVELMAYRKDLFKKYGLPCPPKTWSEVLKAAEVISKNEPGIYGTVMRGLRGNPIVSNFLPVFWAFGARIIDKKGVPRVNSAEAVEALKMWLALAKYSPPGMATFSSDQVKAYLYEGTAAIATEVWPGWIGKLDDPKVSKVVGKVDICVPPGEKTHPSPMIGVWLFGIPHSSRHKIEALKFIVFATSARMQKIKALETGYPPTRKSVYLDPEVVKKYRWYPVQLKALMTSRPRPRVPVWAEIESVLGLYLSKALVGKMSPEEALNAANAEILEILKEAGIYKGG